MPLPAPGRRRYTVVTTRIVVSALAGALVVFVLAFLAFGLVFAEFFARQIPTSLAGVSREAPNVAVIFVADVTYAALLAYLFETRTRIRDFRAGAVTGAIIGFALVLHFDLLSAATTHLTTPAGIAANVAISTVLSGVACGTIGAVLGRLPPAAGRTADPI
jgi:hypothetical protein